VVAVLLENFIIATEAEKTRKQAHVCFLVYLALLLLLAAPIKIIYKNPDFHKHTPRSAVRTCTRESDQMHLHARK
jgi:hypothetical protein